MSSYYLVGIGGSGMSSLAQFLVSLGHQVSGSDRSYDQGIITPVFDLLSSLGINLVRQDGQGVKPGLDMVVISMAVETNIPDVVRAGQLNLPICKRADLLAQLFNERQGIAIAGTSGKSTVTGMIGQVMAGAGKEPAIINGGRMKNFLFNGQPNNIRIGCSNTLIIEADESDGSIVKYNPVVSVITNISKDHKEIPELLKIFQILADQTKEKIVANADCPRVSSLNLPDSRSITFSISKDSFWKAREINLSPLGSSFECQEHHFSLQVPGSHNVYNALACIAVTSHWGISLPDIQEGLAGFLGISRRFDLIGEVRGTLIIDDFAHNPDKIKATLGSVDLLGQRKVLLYKPHGFGPTRFLKQELIESLVNGMSREDVLFIPEIFYAGGTADKDISSRDLVDGIRASGLDARYGETKESLFEQIIEEIKPGNTVVVMGARDDTLTLFSQRIFKALQEKCNKEGAGCKV